METLRMLSDKNAVDRWFVLMTYSLTWYKMYGKQRKIVWFFRKHGNFLGVKIEDFFSNWPGPHALLLKSPVIRLCKHEVETLRSETGLRRMREVRAETDDPPPHRRHIPLLANIWNFKRHTTQFNSLLFYLYYKNRTRVTENINRKVINYTFLIIINARV